MIWHQLYTLPSLLAFAFIGLALIGLCFLLGWLKPRRYLVLVVIAYTLAGVVSPIFASIDLGGLTYHWLWIGIACLFAAVGFILAPDKNARNHVVLKNARSFTSDVWRAPYVVLASLIVGSFFSIVYLSSALAFDVLTEQAASAQGQQNQPDNFNWENTAIGGVGVFFTGIAMVAVLGAFHRRVAPYVDLWELMAQIRSDIERELAEPEPSDIWWVFPGLGLGKYRSLDDDAGTSGAKHKFESLKDVLVRAISNEHINFNAIVYDDKSLEAFYAAYHVQANGSNETQAAIEQEMSGTQPDYAKIAGYLSSALAEDHVTGSVLAERQLLQHGSPTAKIYQTTHPEGLPGTVIVVGDVVYQITNYGSPGFIAAKSANSLPEPFRSVGGIFTPTQTSDDHLISMLTFRREDPAYAKLVKNYLEKTRTEAIKSGMLQKKITN